MESRDKIRHILQEWSEFKLPVGYDRDFDWALLDAREILTVIGARRTGKTYLCFQMIRKLRESLPAGNVIYVNLEDERLYPLQGDELALIWDLSLEIFKIDMTKRVYLFIDEVQNASHWARWTRRICDQNPNVKIVLTGFSSKLLSREIATELRGRTLSFCVFPLSFREYLGASGVKVDTGKILYSRDRPHVKKLFNEYMERGGFPAAVDSLRSRELLKEYYHVIPTSGRTLDELGGV